MVRNKKKVLLAWSGGKDSAYSLYLMQQSQEYEVVGLLEMSGTHRNIQHGVPHGLIDEQARQAGLPLFRHIFSWEIKSRARTWQGYNVLRWRDPGFRDKLKAFHKLGVEYLASGCLDSNGPEVDRVLAEAGLKYLQPRLFPLNARQISAMKNKSYRKQYSLKMAYQAIALGFKAIVVKVKTCLSTEHDENPDFYRVLIGRQYDAALLDEIVNFNSVEMDAGGEDYELHTFVYGGPIFQEEIRFHKGSVVYVGEMDEGVFALQNLFPDGEGHNQSSRE